jgi:hypothetical protein
MAENNAVVGIFNSYTEAETSIKELQKAGFDMKKLSIVGKDYHTEEHVVGYCNAGDRMKVWGKLGAFWGGFWGLLFGSALFIHPGHRSSQSCSARCGLDCRSTGRGRGGRWVGCFGRVALYSIGIP